MLVDVGLRYRPIPLNLGFVFSAREIKGDSFMIRDIGGQDPIHKHKKFINHLDHVSRVNYIAPNLIMLMNHIEMIINRQPVFEYGLT